MKMEIRLLALSVLMLVLIVATCQQQALAYNGDGSFLDHASLNSRGAARNTIPSGTRTAARARRAPR